MRLFLVLIAFLLPGAGFAQTAFELFQRIDPSPELALLADDPEQFETQKLAALRDLAGGSDVLTVDRIAANKERRNAARIADRLRLVGTLDLDGDGEVTLEEGDEAATLKPHLAGRHRRFLRAIDENFDGLLSHDEILEYATRYAEDYPELPRESGETLLRFDLDGDQTVSPAEIRDYVRRVRAILENQPGADPVCILPPRSQVSSYKIIAITGSEARDEQGRPVVVLSKETGAPAKPLVILSRDPIVLTFEGDVSLASFLVVTSDVLEVVGLPADTVIRVPRTPCTTYFGEDRLSHLAVLNRGRMRQAMGTNRNVSYPGVTSFVYW